MRFEKKFDLRNPINDHGPRFHVHVIDGPGEPTPGRLRTIRFDYNCEAADWLKIEWIVSNGRRTGIKSIDLTGDHQEKGSFFLLDAFKQEPNERKRTEGVKLFEEWARRAESGEKVEEFPLEWLPARVAEVRKTVKDTTKPWRVPPFEDPKGGK